MTATEEEYARTLLRLSWKWSFIISEIILVPRSTAAVKEEDKEDGYSAFGNITER